MGKGSAPRKFSVDHQTFSNNWDQIFKKKTCPPCNNDCNQGRDCPARNSNGNQSEHSDRLPDQNRA